MKFYEYHGYCTAQVEEQRKCRNFVECKAGQGICKYSLLGGACDWGDKSRQFPLAEGGVEIVNEENKHDHTCYCGTGDSVPHQTGKDGCVRFMTEPPDLQKATLFTYIQQRGYHQHPCGCWSRHAESDNSVEG
jgi:hypothetical protein